MGPDELKDREEDTGPGTRKARTRIVEDGEVLTGEAGNVQVEVAWKRTRAVRQQAVRNHIAGEDVRKQG